VHPGSQVLEGEKGAMCYGLAKTLSDNIKYVGYEGQHAPLPVNGNVVSKLQP
jgi:hypothetical protein